jgi:multicomponent Na+:H+ antiporter subunit B
MDHHFVVRVIGKLLIPLVLLFALYVQFHGDYGPGGGFQAGVIFAVGFILYGLIYGLDTLRRVLPPWLVRVLVSLGVLIYAGTGIASMLLGSKYLDYSVLGPTAAKGQHYGILIVEFGVGTTVAAVMILIFYSFAGRGRQSDDEATDD